MKDRFLSRGKRIDNGEWVCGNYVHTRKDDYFIYDHDYGVNVDVDPDTVCQCTGITDKNNRLIFEGDIVKLETAAIFSEPEYIVPYRPSPVKKSDINFDVIGTVVWNHVFWDIKFNKYDDYVFENFMWSAKRDDSLEIIGNSTDNPELKEGEAK